MRLLVFALILSIPTIAVADPLDDYAEWFVEFDDRQIETINSAIDNCSADTSHDVSFRDLVATSMFRFYECVTVRGLVRGHGSSMSLYPDWQSLYYAGVASAALFGSEHDEANPFRANVDLPQDFALETGPWLREVEITGAVIDCYAVREFYRRKETVVNLSLENSALIHIGMCPSNSGPTLHAVEIEVGERRRYPRLLPDPANSDFQSLWPIPPEWALASLSKRAFDLYLSSLTSGRTPEDFEQIATEGFLDQIGRGELQYVADSGNGGAILRGLSPSAQREIFLFSAEKRNREPAPSDNDLGLIIVACYCRSGDCASRWPISLSDAYWDARRPYVCAEGWLVEERGMSRFDQISPAMGAPSSPFYEIME